MSTATKKRTLEKMKKKNRNKKFLYVSLSIVFVLLVASFIFAQVKKNDNHISQKNMMLLRHQI